MGASEEETNEALDGLTERPAWRSRVHRRARGAGVSEELVRFRCGRPGENQRLPRGGDRREEPSDAELEEQTEPEAEITPLGTWGLSRRSSPLRATRRRGEPNP